MFLLFQIPSFFYVVGFFLYVFLYTFASFLFNYKIYLVSNNKYWLATIPSGLGIFINFSLYAFIPFLAVVVNIPIAIVLISALATGAFLSNAVMTKIDLFHTNKKENNTEEQKENT